jgi:hypothetical protein
MLYPGLFTSLSAPDNKSSDSPQENLNSERNPLVNVSDIIAQINITPSPASTVLKDTMNTTFINTNAVVDKPSRI